MNPLKLGSKTKELVIQNNGVTIDANDARALKYAGGLGHSVAVVVDSNRRSWGRDVCMECCDLVSAKAEAKKRKGAKVYERIGKVWELRYTA